jgi:hypothetical protein
VAVSQSVYEGTEADALDDATHPQAHTSNCENLAHPPRLTETRRLRKRPIPPANCGIPAGRRGAAPMHPDRGQSTLSL